MKKTKRLLCLILAAALLPLSACSTVRAGDTPRDEPPALPEPEPTSAVIAIASEPSTLHPFDHSAVVCGYMNQMTYNKLFTTDIDTLRPVPELVESFELSEDGLTADFTLRQGVLFHNGEEMTAADAAASLEYASTFAFCTRYTGFWDRVEETGRYSFRLHLPRPYSMMLYDLSSNAACVLPKSLIEAGHDFTAAPVGTGPYIFEAQTLGDSVSFTKNERYFDAGHQPSIDTLTWKVIPEGSSRTIGLETGEIDLVIDVEQNDVQRLSAEEGVSVLSVPGTRISFMTMNSERAPFDNISFRKAMNAAVDRASVLAVAAGGLGEIALSPNPLVYIDASEREALLQNVTDYSPEAAREYLASSGVDTENLVLTCLCYSDDTRRAAEVIQGCLAEAGVTLEIETMDFAAFLTRMLGGDYDCAVAGYSSTNMLTYMRGLWHSSSIGASNSSRIVSSELDALIELAETQTDETARLATLSEICVRTNDLSLLVPLYTSSVIRAASDRIGGLRAGASGLMLYQDLYIK